MTIDPTTSVLEAHVTEARADYRRVRDRYAELAAKVASILREAGIRGGLGSHSITHRAKDDESFTEKVSKVDDANPLVPKYPNPLDEITDLAGVRVITYFLSAVGLFERAVEREFKVLEKANKFERLVVDDRFGYQSVHYLVQLQKPRIDLPEYGALSGLICEIQIRTILQHAWAEIEHDVQYKSQVDIPPAVRRRFLTLAGLLELADREFEAIHVEDQALHEGAATVAKALLHSAGKSDQADPASISGPTLKMFLDSVIGRDARVSGWLYGFVAQIAIAMGYSTIADLDPVVKGFDWVLAQTAQWDTRPSPPSVFEEMLFQSDPELFIRVHPWSVAPNSEWFRTGRQSKLEALRRLRPERFPPSAK